MKAVSGGHVRFLVLIALVAGCAPQSLPALKPPCSDALVLWDCVKDADGSLECSGRPTCIAVLR
jgi:hypothetical protein